MEEITEEKQEITFKISGDQETVIVKFADGERALPDYVVRVLGMEKLQESAAAFAEVTFEEFLSAYNLTIEKQQLNDIGNQFISNHFNRSLF